MKKSKCSEKFGAFFMWFDYESENYYDSNSELLNELEIKKRIYVSRYSPTVIVLLSEEQKKELESQYEITEYLFQKPEKMGDELILSDINASFVYNEAETLGEGVKIGMIAVENIIFDKDAKSLDGLQEEGRIIVYPSVIPPKIDKHPTCVLSEIVGRKITADETEFSGVARDATVYFDALYSVKEIFESIERMLDEGVRVINFSAGTNHDGEYSDFDRQIDRLIINGDFLFVAAAGNFQKTASPGKAYNALTVGNAVTKNSPFTSLPSPFNMSSTSAYSTNTNLPHKPEISAPGEWVGFVDAEGKGDFNNFGTSFSAPLVTGAASQLLGIKNLSYLTLKAIILMSANEDEISSYDNPFISNSIMRLKSGYGMLDVLESINTLKRAKVAEGKLNGEFEYEINSDSFFFIFELDEKINYPRLFLDGDEVALYPETTFKGKFAVKSIRIEGNSGCRFSLISL